MQIDAGNPDLGKSELASPCLQVREHTRAVQVRELARAVQLPGIDHLTILESRHWHWPDEASCAATAERLAGLALVDQFIELNGPLGAGKTTFVRHLLQALGVRGHVKSPTYALMEPYEVVRGGRPLAVWHFDFYRFDDPNEWEDAGFRDIFASRGVKLVEWPDNAGDLLPGPDLRITIDAGDGERREVRADALSAAGVRLLEAVDARSGSAAGALSQAEADDNVPALGADVPGATRSDASAAARDPQA